MKASLHSITRRIPTGGGLAGALAFYSEHMGFAIVWQDGGMAGRREFHMIVRSGVCLQFFQHEV